MKIISNKIYSQDEMLSKWLRYLKTGCQKTIEHPKYLDLSSAGVLL